MAQLARQRRVTCVTTRDATSGPLLGSLFQVSQLLTQGRNPFRVSSAISRAGRQGHEGERELPHMSTSDSQAPQGASSGLRVGITDATIARSGDPLLTALSSALVRGRGAGADTHSGILGSGFSRCYSGLRRVHLQGRRVSEY